MISEEWVLTAAHCVDGEATEVVGVIMINCIKHSIFTVVYIYIYTRATIITITSRCEFSLERTTSALEAKLVEPRELP